jgi:hypothetical protein
MEKDSICTIKIKDSSFDHAPNKIVIKSFRLSITLLSYFPPDVCTVVTNTPQH